MHGAAQPEGPFPPAAADDAAARTDQRSVVGSANDKSNGNPALAEAELDSALQLLTERAQYITGATGAALALPQGEEMVCRASAGSSAPAVGARLQVRSGLTGESISRRQLLRCNNAETDPRVNLETCRALGIASIVVLPLLRRTGEVRGLFELFSDHPYAFEERDLIALERMADLTSTALDLAEKDLAEKHPDERDLTEQRQKHELVPVVPREVTKPVESPKEAAAEHASVIPLRLELTTPAEVENLPPPASVPEAMLRVQKCASCSFPVSEGRSLCLDCEKKDHEKKQHAKEQVHGAEQNVPDQSAKPKTIEDAPSASAPATEPEFVPAFLANAAPVNESWLANHVNLLAIVVLIMGILVAVVVFR